MNEETIARRIKEIQEQSEEGKKADAAKKIEVIKKMESLRPPYVWNLFLEESSPYYDGHRIRYNTDPKALYTDGRVELFLNKLNALYVQLVETNKDRWFMLTEKCFTILANKEEQ